MRVLTFKKLNSLLYGFFKKKSEPDRVSIDVIESSSETYVWRVEINCEIFLSEISCIHFAGFSHVTGPVNFVIRKSVRLPFFRINQVLTNMTSR